MNLHNYVIEVAGLIGVGKTTLCTLLGELLKMPVFKENTDSAMLKKFYEDRKTHGFALQIQLLAERLKQYKQAIHSPNGAIIDRSREEDWAFVQMLVSENSILPEHAVIIDKITDEINRDIRKPDVIVFLHATPEVCLKRIQARARSMEVGISLEYLQTLDNQYVKLEERLVENGYNIISIDWNEFQDTAKIAENIALAVCAFKGQHLRI